MSSDQGGAAGAAWDVLKVLWWCWSRLLLILLKVCAQVAGSACLEGAGQGAVWGEGAF